MEKSDFDRKIAFIVATKDRPLKLKKLLESLDTQSCKPDQIIIIDSSVKHQNNISDEFPELTILYKHFFPPSATKQRNEGIKMIHENIELIGFLDDDIEFERDALEKMLQFWNQARRDVGGSAFNLVNHPSVEYRKLKTSILSQMLGLYSNIRGAVTLSGFHSLIGFADRDINVQWLPSTAVVWRKEILATNKFDEWFDGYSYLEDLDFSYKVGKEYRLMVCAEATYYHYPAETGRGTPFAFGKREVLNRVYFVKKYKELSLIRCYIALLFRLIISFSFAFTKKDLRFILRVFGNLTGLFYSILSFKGRN